MEYDNEDATMLHKKFVDAIKNDVSYRSFLLKLDLMLDALDDFANNGVWVHNFGDLVVKVCADILQIGIFVFPSSHDIDLIPFLPSRIIADAPVFLAYNNGHYDSTKERNIVMIPESHAVGKKYFTLL